MFSREKSWSIVFQLLLMLDVTYWPNDLTFLRFSGTVGVDTDAVDGSGRLKLVPLALLDLEDTEAAGVTGWDGRESFFFFLLGLGSSYVRKDSKDMVGASKEWSSSSSRSGSGLSLFSLPGNSHRVRNVFYSYVPYTLLNKCDIYEGQKT